MPQDGVELETELEQGKNCKLIGSCRVGSSCLRVHLKVAQTTMAMDSCRSFCKIFEMGNKESFVTK